MIDLGAWRRAGLVLWLSLAACSPPSVGSVESQLGVLADASSADADCVEELVYSLDTGDPSGPPIDGPKGCSKWPTNPKANCVGYVASFQTLLAGTKKCETPPTIAQLEQQIWDCFIGKLKGDDCIACDTVVGGDGKAIAVSDPGAISKITADLQQRYQDAYVAYCKAKEIKPTGGGGELVDKLTCEAVPTGEWIPIGCLGTRTYSDGTTAPSLHAVSICKGADGSLWVYDNNDAAYHECVWDDKGLQYTCDYRKPGKPMGAATQCYTTIGRLDEIAKKIAPR